MGQMTIYLPDKLENKARTAAKADGKSISRWIADQLVQHLDEVWPNAVLKAAGAIPDFPDLEQLRKGYGHDAPRNSMK
jgi:hypothetical protein